MILRILGLFVIVGAIASIAAESWVPFIGGYIIVMFFCLVINKTI